MTNKCAQDRANSVKKHILSRYPNNGIWVTIGIGANEELIAYVSQHNISRWLWSNMKYWLSRNYSELKIHEIGHMEM